MAKTNTSIVDYLNSQGQDSSYSARKKLATSLGISDYSGTASQNIQMLNALQSGQTTTTNNENASTNTTTSQTTSTKNTLNGVDDAITNTLTSSYQQSSDVTAADKKSNSALSNLETLTSKDNIVSNSVWKDINSSFKLPSAVVEADTYLASQLEKIQSGKTSYSDQVKDMMDKIMNREKFSYDVDTDPLFQQALASAMNSGKQAMQDTIGQASALTGGYGSTYATTAGNQAYNSFIEDAYDNLPQYYQMALEAYQMEGEEMYKQYSMLSAEDDKEYNRNVTAYDATYQYRNQLYDEAYALYRDDKSDAFATANLQVSEHGQKVSDAYNYYSAASNNANTLYEREYTKWADEVNQAMKYAQLLNSDWWNQSNQDFQASENEKQRAWQSAEAEKERAFTASENAKNRAVKSSGGSGGSGVSATSKIPSQISSKAAKFETDAERADYLDSMVESGYLTQEQADYLYESNISNVQKSVNERTWTRTSTGGLNWGGGIDKNAKVTDEYNNEYTLEELWNEASKTMGKDEAEDWVIKLQKDLGITWW